ncbi:histidine phosphatase family protein [Halalkalibacter urbisdiaboli]|uniref:histidine phosphatase family protein n=1 Tax=Halalkalibacter urbisdiaboli TaxID=1960589 RepID=UPI000B44EF2C|nr:histidine phosphatase family protein [Halalkalibacter urbisdiaboli]
MNLYLIRHGESMGNKLGKIQGCSEFPLSEAGTLQIEKLGLYFQNVQLDFIYSSDLSRAYDSACAIAKRKNMTVHKWEKVREVNLGPFQGKTREEIFSSYPEVKEKSILTSGVKGTESTEQLTARCKSIVEQLMLAHRRHHVAIVSHGGLISIFLMYLMFGERWEELHRPFQIGNTSITHIEWPSSSNKPLIHYVNRNNHLDMTTDEGKKCGLL